jgi:pimeloyl-ACP methyl ester carboxylesterase
MFFGKIEQGEIENCPFIRFGEGKEKIVIFPLINDALFSVREVGWYFRNLFSPLCRDYNIYVIGRKRRLPVGYSTSEMARDYAKVFENADFGQVYLIGISLGGMIAQNFAHAYPQYVQRLIIISSAHHMGPEGLNIARRWIPWTREGRWKEIYKETVKISFHKWCQLFLRLGEPLVVKYLKNKIDDQAAADFIISGQAGVMHDSSSLLSEINMPTAIIGGTEDPFFPETIFREMAERIQGCELLTIKGARHLVLDEHKKQCMRMVAAFFRSSTTTIDFAK